VPHQGSAHRLPGQGIRVPSRPRQPFQATLCACDVVERELQRREAGKQQGGLPSRGTQSSSLMWRQVTWRGNIQVSQSS
jgi:hypothetical protein